MKKKTIGRWGLLLAAFALLAASCGDSGSGDTAPATTAASAAATTAAPVTTAASTGGTLKLGVLLPLTGFIAGPGEDALESLQLYFDTFGDGKTVTAGGTTIEFVVEDTGSDPAVALTAAKKLVDVDHVDIVIPGILASTGGAVGDALGDRTDVLLLSPFSCNDDFTQRTPLVGYARPGGWSCSQSSHSFGKWAYDEAGYRNVATACADYTFGYEHCGGFADAFTAAGGTISNQLWFPPPTQDFGTYATQLNDLNIDAVMGLAVGGSAVPFITAYSDFGLKKKVPLLAGAITTDQSVLRAMDKDTVLGTISHAHWAEGADVAGTKQFVTDFEAATGKIASYYAAGNYTAMEWITAVLERTNGEFTPDLFLTTMEDGMEIATPFGPQTIGEDGAPILTIYITEVQERADGKLWNVPIFQYDNVDQYFPFDKDTYLQQPAYTKDFQGNGVG